MMIIVVIFASAPKKTSNSNFIAHSTFWRVKPRCRPNQKDGGDCGSMFTGFESILCQWINVDPAFCRV